MARGSVAKESVVKQLQKAFGADFLGEKDKKYYIKADDGGEIVQIAITLTCPKTNIEFNNVEIPSQEEAFNWEDDSLPTKPSLEISEEEKKYVRDMMKRLELDL